MVSVSYLFSQVDLCFQIGPLHFCFLTKILNVFLICPMRSVLSTHVILLNFPNIFGDVYKL
jgi:hypothetical protein